MSNSLYCHFVFSIKVLSSAQTSRYFSILLLSSSKIALWKKSLVLAVSVKDKGLLLRFGYIPSSHFSPEAPYELALGHCQLLVPRGYPKFPRTQSFFPVIFTWQFSHSLWFLPKGPFLWDMIIAKYLWTSISMVCTSRCKKYRSKQFLNVFIGSAKWFSV